MIPSQTYCLKILWTSLPSYKLTDACQHPNMEPTEKTLSSTMAVRPLSSLPFQSPHRHLKPDKPESQRYHRCSGDDGERSRQDPMWSHKDHYRSQEDSFWSLPDYLGDHVPTPCSGGSRRPPCGFSGLRTLCRQVSVYVYLVTFLLTWLRVHGSEAGVGYTRVTEDVYNAR